MTEQACKLLVVFDDDGNCTSELVPLDPAELEQRAADEQAAPEQPASELAPSPARAKLLEALAAGTAAPADVQAAVAELLGGDSTGLAAL